MAYVTIPRDLRRVESKVLFGLTKRQLLCFGAAALVGLPLFFLAKPNLGTTTAALCMILVMLPFFLLAMYEKNGQPPEVILGHLIQNKFVRPKVRIYQTQNLYAALVRQSQLEQEVRRIAEKDRKNQKRKPRKLSRAARRQIAAVTRQAKGDGKTHTVQQSIPFQNMFPDGLCRLEEKIFSKTIAFADVNYRLAGPEEQQNIFESLCDFYNSYDPSIGVELTLESRSSGAVDEKLFEIAPQDNDLDPIREEAEEILRMQYRRGNNGYRKTKYVTLTIEAENLLTARARFSRIETDTLSRFKGMGAAAHVLDGKERLELLYNILHPEGGQFAFEWDWLPASGLSVKDFIAPASFEFGETRTFRIGRWYGAVSFLQILAPEMQDRILADLMEADGNILITMHIRGINQNEAIRMIKRKITDLDAMKIQEQKRAVRSGYDMDILPSDLSTYGGAAKELLADLQSRNERMFNLTFLVLHTAATRQKLEIAVSQAASVAQTYNCLLTRLDFQQEDGLMSSLPLGGNRIRIERSLTTSALAVFVPFVTREVFMGGDAIYYGLNALSNNMILLDRKQSRSPNGLVFGTPGSGKSMSCKREITFVMLTTRDKVLICDPEDEYSPLVNRLGGQVIRLSPSSTDYLNPLDINLNYSEEENPLALKSDFVLSFCELIMSSKTGLEPIEKTVIDRAVQRIYQPYFADPRPEKMPILADLRQALLDQQIPEADRVAQALDLYVNGSLNFFNHRTTVDVSNRLVCFDIKGLGKNLKKPGMLIVQDAVWNTVTVNRAIGRSTWYFVDEFHLLLKEEQTASYSAEIWKRFRKWGGVPTGATQNPKDLLSSPEIENILENSDFIYMLNQSAGDRKILAERLNLSEEQLAYLTNAEPGHGLLFFDSVILPFADDFPKDTELYKLLTTKPSEVGFEE
ncbi:MAG TPA: PrgI family protein [Candidatus Pygmaiobacter gallistercoris]|nr:PrgI family protein [Candidatus Pygmaiobacter gallistercoris]